MNELKLIEQREVLGKDFKVYGTAENPLFLAKDVAEWIEHSDVSTMLRNAEDDEKLIQTIFVSGQNREAWFLTEDGLYEVLMQSRKPIAKQFKTEVKKILKTIRQTGGYVNNDEMFINTYLPNADETTKLFVKTSLETFKRLNAKIEQDKPKVLFADAVETSNTSILVGDLAKLLRQNGIEIGQKRLFEWLRNNGYLIKYGESRNMPTQRAMEMKLFEVKERTIVTPNENIRITKTSKVTGKGSIYFINKFCKGINTNERHFGN